MAKRDGRRAGEMGDHRIESILKIAALELAQKLCPEGAGHAPRAKVARERGLLLHSSHRRYRCTVGSDVNSGFVFFAKKAPLVEYRNLIRLHHQEDPDIDSVVPRALSYLPDIQYLLMEYLKGHTLMNLLVADCFGIGHRKGGGTQALIGRSAAALARLHNALAHESGPFYDDRRIDELTAQLSRSSCFSPADLISIQQELDRSRAFLSRVPSIPSHGEFGPRNILILNGSGLAFVDWPHLTDHNLFYDSYLFLNSLLGLARVFPWSIGRLEKLATEFWTTYLKHSVLSSDPRLFKASRLANQIEILLRSHRRLSKARNWRVLLRAKSYIQYQKRKILISVVPRARSR